MNAQQKLCLSRFETVAREWLELRLEYVALREKVKGEVHDPGIRCENLELKDTGFGFYWEGTPCHRAGEHVDPGDWEPLDEDDYCEPCKRRLVLVEQRRILGRKQAGKLRSLYAIFKNGG